MLVGAGDVVNINIMFRLRYLTDGAHTSQLNILLGSLITKYPETFLLALEKNIYNVNRLDSILCNLGPQFVDEFELQTIELRNRYEALKEVEGVCNVVRELTLTKIQLAICRRERIILEIDINS